MAYDYDDFLGGPDKAAADYVIRGNGRWSPLTKPKIAFIVDPKGRIRPVRYSYHQHSPILDVEAATDRVGSSSLKPGKPVAMRRPPIRAKKHQEGYRYLEDLYADDGNPAGMAVYLQWQAAVERGDNGAPKRLPDEYLPSEVLRRRKEYVDKDPNKRDFVLPPLPSKSEPEPEQAKKSSGSGSRSRGATS